MKKVFITSCLIMFSIFCAGCVQKVVGMANPWTDCQDNLKQAAKIAGFEFPLKLSNYSVRAMSGMIEITYPLDEFRDVEVRKTVANMDNHDISGVYTKYPVDKEIMLYNNVPVRIRGENNKIYVMNMVAETGYYSAYCEKGMTLKEIEGIYEVLREAEEPKPVSEAYDKKVGQSYYDTCELGDLVGEDVKRINLKGFYIDYHSNDYDKKQAKKIGKTCLKEGVNSQFQMDCCVTRKMFPGEDNK